MDSKLIAFYRGQSPDAAGRMIADIWAWDHRRLEMVHDYIQWLFPLPDANPDLKAWRTEFYRPLAA